jgi:hypothetical protein
MQLLQNYPSVDVMVLIKSAHQMWENDILLTIKENERLQRQRAPANNPQPSESTVCDASSSPHNE